MPKCIRPLEGYSFTSKAMRYSSCVLEWDRGISTDIDIVVDTGTGIHTVTVTAKGSEGVTKPLW